MSADSSRLDLPFTSIGPYRILAELGRGGMGAVYRGLHPSREVEVAIKVVRVPDPGLLRSIRREISALTRLRHPGIVAVRESGIQGGMPWYAMDLVAGEPLDRYCQRRWNPQSQAAAAVNREASTLISPGDGEQTAFFSPATKRTGAAQRLVIAPAAMHHVLTVLRRLCGPLAYLHGEGIVHGDLKPANIVVTPDGLPLLLDFGMARLVRRHGSALDSGTHEALDVVPPGGTLQYIAPELLLNLLPDARTDIYAFGCILFELLTGEPPFSGRGQQVASAHLRQEPRSLLEILHGIPAELANLVARLLAKRPADRIGYADIIAAKLGELGGENGAWRDAPAPRTFLYRPELHGRDSALRRLVCRVDRILADEPGGLLMLRGESGVGKTRLMVELTRLVSSKGALVLAGECQPGRGRELQGVRRLLEAIADHCRSRGADAARDILGARGRLLEQYEPCLRGLTGLEDFAPPVELPATEAQVRLFSYLAECLRRFGQYERIVLVIDDLQWADELTLGFLRFALQGGHLASPPLMIIATVRSEEEGASVSGLATLPNVEIIEIARLDQDAVRALIRDMLDRRAADPVVENLVVDHSEGNPFFAAEYLYAAVQAGLLARDGAGRWLLRTPDTGGAGLRSLALPRNLRDVILRRLDGLSAAARDLVEAANVLGRELPLEVLEGMIGPDAGDLSPALHELLTRRFLEDTERADVLRFGHDKLREVTCDALDPNRRRHLHERAATALEALPIGADGYRSAARLAHHWEQAGDALAAQRYYVQAARDAARLYANEDAAQYFERVLALQTAPTAASVVWRCELGRLPRRIRKASDAASAFSAALTEATALGDEEAQIPILTDLGLVSEDIGDLAQAEDWLKRALLRATRHHDCISEAKILAALGLTLRRRHCLDSARSTLRLALETAQSCGERKTEAIPGRTSDPWSGPQAMLISLLTTTRKRRESASSSAIQVWRSRRSPTLASPARNASEMPRQFACLARPWTKPARWETAARWG
ncbi:MAG: protein kinase [Candidatus Schekmanbacteria bacterium]|nr:protein kinase [Candidatus Schekmanbacteria bacterium]